MGQFKKGHIPWHKGKKQPYSEATLEKMREAKLRNPIRYWLGKKRPNLFSDEVKKKFSELHTGEKNVNWKGENAGYDAKHDWVYRKLGVPKKCKHCGLPNGKHRGQWILDWANKSHKYKRDVNDWIALCLKCHRAYDKNK